MYIKIKYCVAAAALLAAAAFCACGKANEEVVPIERQKEQSGAEEQSGQEFLEMEAAGDPGEKKESGVIKVYVCGAVKYPDVYTVDISCRTVDAVEAAGGFLPDAGKEYINLASSLTDGQKIYIPTKKEIEDALALDEGMYSAEVNITTNTPGISSTDNPSDNGQDNSGLVDINSASRETLMTLPGIGASKADSIIAYRQSNGRFSGIEDIMLVDGIKEGLFNKVKDRICAR